jgi:uncharacterized repeat protein (TIGR01451 family)
MRRHRGLEGNAVARLLRRSFAIVTLVSLGVLVATPTAWAASAPDLTVTKSSNAVGSLSVGDVFTYTITVSNEGTATAHDVNMGDDLPQGLVPQTILPVFPDGWCAVASSVNPSGTVHRSVFCHRDALDAGASASVSFDVKVIADVACGELTNTAKVAASDEPSGATGNDSGSVTDTVACPPSISIHTTAPAYARVGDTVALTMKVENTGWIDLQSVRVADPGCGGAPDLITDGNGDATLAAGETWVYRCGLTVDAAIGDRLTSTATVSAQSDAGPARASDRATVRILRPRLTLRVATDRVSGAVGETITYRFTVRNTGDSTLSDLSIDDDQLGHVGDVARLVPGHQVTLSVERLLTTRHVWVTDEATATGTDPGGRPVTATARASVTIVASGDTQSHRAGGDGTAFTGSRVTGGAIAAVVLAAIGAGVLLLSRRRRA